MNAIRIYRLTWTSEPTVVVMIQKTYSPDFVLYERKAGEEFELKEKMERKQADSGIIKEFDVSEKGIIHRDVKCFQCGKIFKALIPKTGTRIISCTHCGAHNSIRDDSDDEHPTRGEH